MISNCSFFQFLLYSLQLLQKQITSSILYSKMHGEQSQALKHLLRQRQIPLLAFNSFLQNLEKDAAIQKLFLIVQQLLKGLSKNEQPYVRVNSIVAAFKMLNLANYSFLLLAQIYLMPEIQKVVQFVISESGLQHLTQYFNQEAHYVNVSNIQNLSYNFVTICCDFVRMAATIKPLKAYQGREYSDSTNFKRSWHKLQKSLGKDDYEFKTQKGKEAESIREKYLYSLSKWNEYQDSLVQFFMRVLEQNLREQSEHQKYALNFTDILKYGQPEITSQTIARLIEIISSSSNFKIRTRALKLLDNLILWGDVEALLVVNFTEHVQLVIRNILYVDGENNIEEGMNIYPEIEGQQQQKLQFYTYFLKCIQTWAECYPQNDYLGYQNKMRNEQSVIYKLYKMLKQTKKIKFPQNLMIARYQKQSHYNMNKNMIRNQMILIDISSQIDKDDSEMSQPKTFEEVQKYYEEHKEYLLQVLNNGANGLDQKMNKLLSFKDIFQNYVQSIEIMPEMTQNIDLLIENGLELIDLIETIHPFYLEYLKRQYTYSDFKQAINKICMKYYRNNEQGQSEGHFRRFLSEKFKTKRNDLSFTKLQSIPAQNELKLIVNNENIKQIRAKYKKKMGKAQTNCTTQGSNISLQIFTRTRKSKDNNDKNQKDKKDNSSLLQNSLKKDLQSKLNQLQPLSRKSQKVNEAKVTKNRIIVKSKQKMNKSNSLTKISRENKPPIASSKLNTLPENPVESQVQIQTVNTMQPEKNETIKQLYKFNISIHQNEEYYQYFRNETFKYSYVLAHIIIFRSEQLLVERVICQTLENNKIKVKIYIILIPRSIIYGLQYKLQNEGSIVISDKSKVLPLKILPDMRYVIELIGEMKKIPLNLPTIAFYANNSLVLQYVLPFTINFFFDCLSNETQVLTNFRAFQSLLHYECISQKFKCSQMLFPQDKTDTIFMYFPHILKLSKIGDPKEIFLWQVKYNSYKFLIVIEHHLNLKQMVVKLKAQIDTGQGLLPFYKYVVNWFVRLLGTFDKNRV